MELAFAGLHQLCAPMLDRLERLPGPQRDALGTAFGLRAGDAPDRFLVGLAVLSLLSEVAEERPLVCVVDDAQWLDRASAQALAFVARRLLAESVAVVVRRRASPATARSWRACRSCVVEGLRDGDARALLGSVIRGPLDERVRDRIVAETRGNPLALLELPRGLTPAELAGGFGLPRAPCRCRAGSRRASGGGWRRCRRQTRRLLLVAAAEPVGDPALLWRAAERLGIGADAAPPAEAAGLVEFGAPRAVPPSAGALGGLPGGVAGGPAGACTARWPRRPIPSVDPDRRAWHRAHATPGPDEDVAAELERSAGRAQARGGLAAAAAFLERAAALTPDPARRGARALAAAQAKHQAGAPDAALGLLAIAEAGPLDELQRARVGPAARPDRVRPSRGSDAPPLLLAAAERLEPLDAALARETYLEAFVGGDVRRPAGRRRRRARRWPQAARAAPPPAPAPPRAGRPAARRPGRADHGGLRGRRAAAAARARARSAAETMSGRRRCAGCGSPCRIAADLWDDESWHVLAARAASSSPARPARSTCSRSPSARASACTLFAGELAAAASLVEEASGHRGDRQPARAVRRPRAGRLAGPAKPRPPALIDAAERGGGPRRGRSG